ncbi:M28 family peptidase [Paraflavitalea sp. CAU 1676]|uniref:M28 family peptidase n=1 Tax=Paraflavitalea sp. CAU 1676 TaxID=3032598 RepID=UPI0023DB803F|nr:M28 family peptidase [Paraflavitalea sp. CAU 1676]MDF2190765.1 M28 family peptidase [Paraflavitalea sp. CAU 1676]
MMARCIRVMIFSCCMTLLVVSCKPRASKNPEPARSSKTIVQLDSTSLIHDLEYLSSPALEGRETGSPGNALAQAYITRIFDSLQLQQPNSGRKQEFPMGKREELITGTNLLAIIQGSVHPDQYLVISAHYDHLGEKGGKIYFGADDNASGTACLLALARYFKLVQPRHSIILASFDAEEKGLVGSSWFVHHLPVDSSRILLNVNMDMVSRSDKHEIYASGFYHYPFLQKFVDSIKPITPVTVSYGHDKPSDGADDWTNQSDHYPFHKAGIPYIYFGVEDHPDYHQPTDSFEKIDKAFYYQACEMIRETITLLDKQQSLK